MIAPDQLAAANGERVRLTITAPVKRGRSYVSETSTHEGRLVVDRLGVAIYNEDGRLVVGTMRAYVDRVEVTTR